MRYNPKNYHIKSNYFKNLPEELQQEILEIVTYEATRTCLKPELILAVIAAKSDFRKYAISVAGVRGLMQILPFWVFNFTALH